KAAGQATRRAAGPQHEPCRRRLLTRPGARSGIGLPVTTLARRALQHLALNSLRGDVQSVSDLGDGRYELTTYLQNVGGSPIYVMSPELRAYVQVKTVWQEVPMKPIEDAASGVLKIEGKQTYRYLFDARVRDYTQLL